MLGKRVFFACCFVGVLMLLCLEDGFPIVHCASLVSLIEALGMGLASWCLILSPVASWFHVKT